MDGDRCEGPLYNTWTWAAGKVGPTCACRGVEGKQLEGRAGLYKHLLQDAIAELVVVDACVRREVDGKQFEGKADLVSMSHLLHLLAGKVRVLGTKYILGPGMYYVLGSMSVVRYADNLLLCARQC